MSDGNNIIAFNSKKSNEEKILARAETVGVTKEKATWVIEKYIDGKTFSQLCRIGESEKACQVRIGRIVKKLNN